MKLSKIQIACAAIFTASVVELLLPMEEVEVLQQVHLVAEKSGGIHKKIISKDKNIYIEHPLAKIFDASILPSYGDILGANGADIHVTYTGLISSQFTGERYAVGFYKP